MHWKLKTVLATLALSVIGWTASGADAQANWDNHCAKCHGQTGNGETKRPRKHKLKDYTDAKVQAKLTDEHMIKATKEGVKEGGKPAMKAYSPQLSDAEIKDLVAFIRKMKK